MASSPALRIIYSSHPGERPPAGGDSSRAAAPAGKFAPLPQAPQGNPVMLPPASELGILGGYLHLQARPKGTVCIELMEAIGRQRFLIALFYRFPSFRSSLHDLLERGVIPPSLGYGDTGGSPQVRRLPPQAVPRGSTAPGAVPATHR